MATIEEQAVVVEVALRRNSVTGDAVAITARTLDANGETVRQKLYDGMLPNLSPTRQAQVGAILDDAVAFVKNRLGIA